MEGLNKRWQAEKMMLENSLISALRQQLGNYPCIIIYLLLKY